MKYALYLLMGLQVIGFISSIFLTGSLVSAFDDSAKGFLYIAIVWGIYFAFRYFFANLSKKSFKQKKVTHIVDSEEGSMEFIQNGIENMENYILEKMKAKTDVKADKAIFDSGKKNYVRLSERFKHDKLKLKEVTKDRYDYLVAHAGLIYENPLIGFGTNEDVAKIRSEEDDFIIKIQEINKRFKNLLGDEYIGIDLINFKID